MNFSTKAKNLLFLKKLNLKKSRIPKFYKFNIEEIFENKSLIVNKIRINLSKKISVRSSFLLEDQNKLISILIGTLEENMNPNSFTTMRTHQAKKIVEFYS